MGLEVSGSVSQEKESPERRSYVDSSLQYFPDGMIHPPELPKNLEYRPKSEQLQVYAEWLEKIAKSGFKESVEPPIDRKRVEEKEKLKQRAQAIATTLESERYFMPYEVYSRLKSELITINNILETPNASTDDFQKIRLKLDKIKDEIVRTSDEGHRLFEQDKQKLSDSISSLRERIEKIKDRVSEEQIQSWENTLETIANQVHRGSLTVKEVVELGRRINLLDEEIFNTFLEAERNRFESTLTQSKSDIELLPADFEERGELIATINDLIDRLKSATTIEELVQIREEFDALIKKIDSAYEQYLQRKEDEEFPNTLDAWKKAFSTDRGRTNLLRNLKNAFLGKTEDDTRNRLKDLAIGAFTSGATLAGLSIAHPDPLTVMAIAAGLEGVVAASTGAYSIVGAALEQGERTYPKFRELSKKLAKKVSRRRAPNLTFSKLMRINQSDFMKVILHTQPIVFTMAAWATLVGGAEMLDAKAALQHATTQPPEVSSGDQANLPNPGVHIKYPSTPTASASGNVEHIPPVPITVSELPPGFNGIDWTSIQGDNASTKIWNYLQHEGGFSHLGPDVNGVKNLLVELAQLHNPNVVHGNVNEILKSLEHIDIKKMAQVLDVLAHGDSSQVQQLKNYYGDALIQTLQRCSTGLHGVSAPQMYLSRTESEAIQQAFAVLPTP